MKKAGSMPDLLAPPQDTADEQPCMCRTARWLRNPVFYVLGVGFCAMAIASALHLHRPGESARVAHAALGFSLLLGWLSAHPAKPFYSAGRWRRPKTYAALAALLLILGTSTAMLVGGA